VCSAHSFFTHTCPAGHVPDPCHDSRSPPGFAPHPSVRSRTAAPCPALQVGVIQVSCKGSHLLSREKIPWKEGSEESSVSEDQYQERFWRRRLDGIGLDTVNRVFLAIEFKRTQDARSESGSSRSGPVKELASRPPSGRSSQRVAGTTNCVCRRDVWIGSC
jgi:hypothetical protein